MPKFSRHSRITTAREFDEVFSQGQWKRNDPFVHLLWMPRSSGVSRLGIKVSKKNVRLASDRNRLKRITRESFRHQADILGSYDCIVLIRKDAGTLTNDQFRQRVDHLWTSFRKS